jgi:hypothetical protein
MEIRRQGFHTVGDLVGDVDTIVRRLTAHFNKVAKENAWSEKDSKRFWWEQICRHLFAEEWNDPKTKNTIFRKVMGQTSKFTLGEIRYCFESAIRWRKNPPALFWKLVKAKRAEIKKQLGQ